MLKTFKTFIIGLAVVELLSAVGFAVPMVREAAFFAVLALALLVSLYSLRYGLYMLFAELAVGSKGYVLWYAYDGVDISLRLGLFFVVMCVWLGKVVVDWMSSEHAEQDIDPFLLRGKTWKELPKNVRETVSGLSKKRTEPWGVYGWYIALFIAIAWAGVNGYLQNNGLQNIFLDANGWLYFGIVFPFAYVVKKQVHEEGYRQRINLFWRGLVAASAAGVTWVTVKTLVLLYIFSHNLPYFQTIYRWVRETGVGEITRMESGFYRIFIQSHVWAFIAFFAVAAWTVWYGTHHKWHKLPLSAVVAFIGLCAVMLLGLSRSFWAGLAVGCVVYGVASVWVSRHHLKAWLAHAAIIIVAGFASIGLVWGIVAFPFPDRTARFDARVLTDRTQNLDNEEAASSRWQLLPVLWQEITQAPAQGKGFGEEVVYISNDPRVREQNPSGEYATTAFEWGWLDMWLKLGVVGVFVYIGLLAYVAWYMVRMALQPKDEMVRMSAVAALGALAFVAATHMVSPYLNHPLGIGFVVAVSVWVESHKHLVKKK